MHTCVPVTGGLRQMHPLRRTAPAHPVLPGSHPPPMGCWSRTCLVRGPPSRHPVRAPMNPVRSIFSPSFSSSLPRCLQTRARKKPGPRQKATGPGTHPGQPGQCRRRLSQQLHPRSLVLLAWRLSYRRSLPPPSRVLVQSVILSLNQPPKRVPLAWSSQILRQKLPGLRCRQPRWRSPENRPNRLSGSSQSSSNKHGAVPTGSRPPCERC